MGWERKRTGTRRTSRRNGGLNGPLKVDDDDGVGMECELYAHKNKKNIINKKLIILIKKKRKIFSLKKKSVTPSVHDV